jgi:ribonuclease D
MPSPVQKECGKLSRRLHNNVWTEGIDFGSPYARHVFYLNLKTSITKDELAALPLCTYQGPIVLVSTSDDLQRAREDLQRTNVVGLDTETPPAFRVGESHLPALVQVATSQAVYLFRLKQPGPEGRDQVLKDLFENEALVKTGIGLADDFRTLKARFDFKEKNVVDLASLARKRELEQTGVRNLAGMLLGFRISKGQKITNWGRRELTQRQIVYAATDAWVCLELYRYFQEG